MQVSVLFFLNIIISVIPFFCTGSTVEMGNFFDVDSKKIPSVVTTSVSVNQSISSSMLLSSPTIAHGQFEISKSGRYSFASDIIANPSRNNKAIIYVAASDVILDLGGKTLTMTYSSSNIGITGIVIAQGARNIVICNGTISGFAGGGEPLGALKTGIVFSGCSSNIQLENITITGCYGAGIVFLDKCSNVRMEQIAVQGIADPTALWPYEGSKYGLYIKNCSDFIIERAMFDGSILPTTTEGVYSAVGMYCEGSTNVRMIDVSASSNRSLSKRGGSAYGIWLHGCMGCSCERVYAIGNSINAIAPASAVCAGFFTDNASKGMIFTDCSAHYNFHGAATPHVYTTVVSIDANASSIYEGSEVLLTQSGQNTTQIYSANDVMCTTTNRSTTIITTGQYPSVAYSGVDRQLTSSWIDSIVTTTWIGTYVTSSWVDTLVTTTALDLVTTETWMDLTVTYSWLDTLMTYSHITITMDHWLPDAAITCSVYGFRFTQSSDSAMVIRCSANQNEGGFTAEGFSCDALNRSVFKDCSALGNISYATNANVTAYGFRSEFGSANQWLNCIAQGNSVGLYDFSHSHQGAYGIGLRSEKFSIVTKALCQANSGGFAGMGIGLCLAGECNNCIIQECQFLANNGASCYGFKDFSLHSTALLKANLAFGQGFVFIGNPTVVNQLVDSGSMNYMLRYSNQQANMCLLIQEATVANMENMQAFSSGGLAWYNISFAGV